MRTGDTFKLNATLLPAGSAGSTVIWSTSSPRVATVGIDGLVTAVGPGLAKIIASTSDGLFSAQSSVSVAIGLPLLPNFGLPVWKRGGFSVPVSNFDPSFQWSASISGSNSTSLPTLSLLSTGVLEISNMSDGSTATVEVKSSKLGYENGITAFNGSSLSTGEQTVVIKIPATSVSVNPNVATMSAGTSLEVVAVVLPNNATDKKVFWTSSNTRIATVVDGKIFGVGTGNVTIQAISRDGGFTAKLNLTVTIGQAVTPKFGLATFQSGVLKVKVSNFDSNYTWIPSILSTDSKSKPSVSFGNDGFLTVTGLTKDSKINLQLTVSRPGFDQSSAGYEFIYLNPDKKFINITKLGKQYKIKIALGKKFQNQRFTLQGNSSESGTFAKILTGKLNSNGEFQTLNSLKNFSEIRLTIFGLELPPLPLP
jgi:uncharacterized protein YjdB